MINTTMQQGKEVNKPKQKCPVCGNQIGVIAGSKDAICVNCGFKDPCCE